VIRGAGWTLFGHGASLIIRLGSSLILTRLLAPDMYGVMAVGYMVITGLTMLSDLGLAPGAIKSHRGNDRTFLNVTWVVQMARGVVIMLIALVISAMLALGWGTEWLPTSSVYSDPRMASLIAIVSLYGFVSGMESTKVILARRDLSLGPLTRIDLTAQVATTLFMLLWAYVAPSVWALAFGYVFGAAVRTGLSHLTLAGPPNRIEWDKSSFQEVIHFAKWIVLSSPLSFLLTSGDRILLGGFLNAEAMGAYSIAFLVLSALQAAIIKVVGSTVLPALSELVRERPHELKTMIYRIRRPLDIVCLFSAGVLFFLGDPIIHLLYDARYRAAGWMLGVLALTLVATRLDVFDQCLLALGRTKLLSGLNGIRLIALYSLVPIGYYTFGIKGAVAAVASSAIVNSTAVLTVQARLKLINWRAELMGVPILAAGLLFGWMVQHVLPH
jgi:O-antigen/teichoic acid export membrane protein